MYTTGVPLPVRRGVRGGRLRTPHPDQWQCRAASVYIATWTDARPGISVPRSGQDGRFCVVGSTVQPLEGCQTRFLFGSGIAPLSIPLYPLVCPGFFFFHLILSLAGSVLTGVFFARLFLLLILSVFVAQVSVFVRAVETSCDILC